MSLRGGRSSRRSNLPMNRRLLRADALATTCNVLYFRYSPKGLPFLSALWFALQSKALQIRPIAYRTFLWRAHSGKHILFDDAPIVIASFFQLLDHSREIHVALAQLAENSISHRCEIIPSILTSLPGDSRFVIFEVNMPDTAGMFADAVESLRTPRSS